MAGGGDRRAGGRDARRVRPRDAASPRASPAVGRTAAAGRAGRRAGHPPPPAGARRTDGDARLAGPGRGAGGHRPGPPGRPHGRAGDAGDGRAAPGGARGRARGWCRRLRRAAGGPLPPPRPGAPAATRPAASRGARRRARRARSCDAAPAARRRGAGRRARGARRRRGRAALAAGRRGGWRGGRTGGGRGGGGGPPPDHATEKRRRRARTRGFAAQLPAGLAVRCRELTFSYAEGRDPFRPSTGVGFELEPGSATACSGRQARASRPSCGLLKGLDEPGDGKVWLDGRGPEDPAAPSFGGASAWSSSAPSCSCSRPLPARTSPSARGSLAGSPTRCARRPTSP